MGELCTNEVLLLMNSVLPEKLQIKRIQKFGAISKQNLKKYTSIVLIQMMGKSLYVSNLKIYLSVFKAMIYSSI